MATYSADRLQINQLLYVWRCRHAVINGKLISETEPQLLCVQQKRPTCKTNQVVTVISGWKMGAPSCLMASLETMSSSLWSALVKVIEINTALPFSVLCLYSFVEKDVLLLYNWILRGTLDVRGYGNYFRGQTGLDVYWGAQMKISVGCWGGNCQLGDLWV